MFISFKQKHKLYIIFKQEHQVEICFTFYRKNKFKVLERAFFANFASIPACKVDIFFI